MRHHSLTFPFHVHPLCLYVATLCFKEWCEYLDFMILIWELCIWWCRYAPPQTCNKLANIIKTSKSGNLIIRQMRLCELQVAIPMWYAVMIWISLEKVTHKRFLGKPADGTMWDGENQDTCFEQLCLFLPLLFLFSRKSCTKPLLH